MMTIVVTTVVVTNNRQATVIGLLRPERGANAYINTEADLIAEAEKVFAPEGTLIPASLDSSSGQFLVTLDCSPGKPSGIGVDVSDPECCLVSRLTSDSAVEDWNLKCPKHCVVKPWCRIMRIGGKVLDSDQIREKLLQNVIQVITMECPRELAVCLRKRPGQTLGIDISHSLNTLGLLIKSVNPEGLVPEWNSANPHSAVKAGDRITSVDGISDARKMIELLKSSGEIHFKVLSWTVSPSTP